MKKHFAAIVGLIMLSPVQVFADGISGGARFNVRKGKLIVPCVKVNDPGGPLDGQYFDVEFNQRGGSLNFEVNLGEEEDGEVCIALIEASLAADEDSSDVNGDLGDDSSDEDESESGN